MIKATILFLCSLFQQDPFVARVVRVIDGDTIEVLKDSTQSIRIRLNGIDAPETGQAYGKKSKEFASFLLSGKLVSVAPHGKDRYGRVLADIYLEEDSGLEHSGGWFNEIIVKAGFAWHYKKYSSDQKLARAEAIAKQLKLGLWRDVNPVPPWDYRHRN